MSFTKEISIDISCQFKIVSGKKKEYIYTVANYFWSGLPILRLHQHKQYLKLRLKL